MDINQKTVNAIRILAADCVQKANSGHPGAPMGMAPAAYALFKDILKFNSKESAWENRDRFILSSGHASALLYSLLHLFGYNLSMEDLKNFRQLHSLTPGHPEFGLTDGVEVTTGPLGQGVANAVGMAIAETMLAAKFNHEDFPIVDHYTYALCGDGCMMEGIASEASSLAGTLKLNKLILIYDDNEISIEGNTNIAMREDIPASYEAYGWNVIKVKDGNDYKQVSQALTNAKASDKPSLIVCPTIIGFGCDSMQGTADVHGSPLGEKGMTEARKTLGVDTPPFTVSEDVIENINKIVADKEEAHHAWNKLLSVYSGKYPELYKEWLNWNNMESEITFNNEIYKFEGKNATRNYSGDMINRLASLVPNLVGGSADLAPSNKTYIKNGGDYSAENRLGRNLHFGVREHAMAAICNGIALHGGLKVFCGTFFIFSDYMKPAIRLSALMKLPVIYVLTHDSIGVGEDGATHQPIEQLAGLRSIPDLNVFRPCDGHETAYAWTYAVNSKKPCCLVLSRQNLPTFENSDNRTLLGAYILKDSKKETPDILLMASGSEVQYIAEAQEVLIKEGIDARVISVPCMELFNTSSYDYKEKIMPNNVDKRIALEAAATMPWYKYVGLNGTIIGIDQFGASAPAEQLYEAFGITTDKVVQVGRELMK